MAQLSCSYEAGLVSKLSQLTDQIAQRTDELELAMVHLGDESDVMVQADYVRDEILPKMGSLRAAVDEAETHLDSEEVLALPQLWGTAVRRALNIRRKNYVFHYGILRGGYGLRDLPSKDLTVLSPVDRMTPGS